MQKSSGGEGSHPRILTAEEGAHPTPSPAFGPAECWVPQCLWPGAGRRGARGRKRPGVGTQTFVPLNFSAVVAPCISH